MIVKLRFIWPEKLLAIHSNLDAVHVCGQHMSKGSIEWAQLFKQTVSCVFRNADEMPTGSRDVTLASLTLPGGWHVTNMNISA